MSLLLCQIRFQSIEQGELFSLFGYSSCGITTPIPCPSGFENPDEGEILLGDEVMIPWPQKPETSRAQ